MLIVFYLCLFCISDELKYWFNDLKNLVEDTYEVNKKTPITFIAHSMGSPMVLLFLQQQTLEWKQKHILRIISLAGAWAGSVKAVKVFAMGWLCFKIFKF